MKNNANKSNIYISVLSVSGIVFLAKIFGFVKQMVTANAFGATIQTDIISLSEGLVANLDYLLVQALSTAFIPTYIYANTINPKIARKFVSNLIKVFLGITICIAVLCTILSPVLSRILAPSYSSELSAQLAKYIRIFAPVLVVIVELAIFNALLKANEKFVPGELIGFNQSVILIILVFAIGKKVGPDTLVIGFYAYALFNLIYLTVLSRQYWAIMSGNPFADEHVLKLLKMMGPLLLGYSMIFVNQQVDKIIVSGLGEGTITAMNYAAVLSNFVSTFTGSIAGILFTYITQNIANNKNKKAADLAMTSMIQMVTLLLPVSIITVCNSREIVSIVFGRGRFDEAAVAKCSLALIGYGCMFVPYVMRELFSRFQYAYGDSKRPMINSTIAIAFNIIFSIALSFKLGVLGVTLATSLSVSICAALNLYTSRKKNKYLKYNRIVRYIPQWIIGSIYCAVIAYFGHNTMQTIPSVSRFLTIATVSLIGYMAINISIIIPLINRLMKRNSK